MLNQGILFIIEYDTHRISKEEKPVTEYRGRWSSIKGPLIGLSAIIILVSALYLFTQRNFIIYFLIALFLAFVPLAYSGLILKIRIDEKGLVVIRPLTRTAVRFEDVALCVMHCVEEDSYLIYAFVRQRGSKGYTVKGIKPKLPFDEVIKRSLNDESMEMDLNFSKAKKIPVSFVENGGELKDRFMEEVGRYHARIAGNQS